jgi:hypothetical protein
MEKGDGMYVAGGRDSVPPERLLKASLLMAFYTVRSERLFPSSVPQPAFPFRPQHVFQKSGAVDTRVTPPGKSGEQAALHSPQLNGEAKGQAEPIWRPRRCPRCIAA